MSVWSVIQNDWHKIVVVLLALAHVWRYFVEYIRPTIKEESKTKPMTITLPKEGCTITITPLKEEKVNETSE